MTDKSSSSRAPRTDEEWRRALPPRRYAVLRRAATEPPGSSLLLAEHRAGRYLCGGCGHPLFDSAAKFDSGSGWPSFTRALPEATGTSTDWKLVYPRTEVHCANCGGHLGHLFEDGPAPSGQRWCINGLALDFDATPSE